MKAEYVDAWVAALRSGEYEQGQQALKMNNKYCCIGVLVDLIIKNNWLPECNLRWKSNYPATDILCWSQWPLMRIDVIPPEVAYLIKLKNKEQSILATMNDRGSSFNEIADYIETNLKDI